MTRILIPYGTREGQTAKIAEYVGVKRFVEDFLAGLAPADQGTTS